MDGKINCSWDWPPKCPACARGYEVVPGNPPFESDGCERVYYFRVRPACDCGKVGDLFPTYPVLDLSGLYDGPEPGWKFTISGG